MNVRTSKLGLIGMLVAVAALVVIAQPTRPVLLTSDEGVWANGEAGVTAPGTNTYYVACSEVEALPIDLRFAGDDGAADSTVQLFAFRSLDSITYETTPFYSQLVTLDGENTVQVITNLNVQGGAILKFQIGNTNEAVGVTNLYGLTRAKARKMAVIQSSR